MTVTVREEETITEMEEEPDLVREEEGGGCSVASGESGRSVLSGMALNLLLIMSSLVSVFQRRRQICVHRGGSWVPVRQKYSMLLQNQNSRFSWLWGSGQGGFLSFSETERIQPVILCICFSNMLTTEQKCCHHTFCESLPR